MGRQNSLLRGKKVLVTGGAGYIGSFIVRELKKSGFTPLIADNLSCGAREAVLGFELVKLDLASQKEKLEKLFSKEKFAGVVHMASFIQMGESFRDPIKYYRNNLAGAVNLLDVMIKHKVQNFIFSSSAGVYGNPKKLPIGEDDPKNPLNPYGETKYMIEKILSSLDRAYGIRFVALRYFNAAGAAMDGSIGEDHPNESHLIPLVIKATMEGKEFTIFGDDYKTKDGTNVRDYIHVLDLARAHVLALNYLLKGGKSDFFNAGVGRGYSNKEIIDEVQRQTGLKVKVKIGPRRPGDADSLYASSGKIKKALGWEAKLGLKDIVKSAYLWHRKHPKGYK